MIRIHFIQPSEKCQLSEKIRESNPKSSTYIVKVLLFQLPGPTTGEYITIRKPSWQYHIVCHVHKVSGLELRFEYFSLSWKSVIHMITLPVTMIELKVIVHLRTHTLNGVSLPAACSVELSTYHDFSSIRISRDCAVLTPHGFFFKST